MLEEKDNDIRMLERFLLKNAELHFLGALHTPSNELPLHSKSNSHGGTDAQHNY